jgi:hypothetical protein
MHEPLVSLRVSSPSSLLEPVCIHTSSTIVDVGRAFSTGGHLFQTLPTLYIHARVVTSQRFTALVIWSYYTGLASEDGAGVLQVKIMQGFRSYCKGQYTYSSSFVREYVLVQSGGVVGKTQHCITVPYD